MTSFHFLPTKKPTWKIHTTYGTARGDPILMEGTVLLPQNDRRHFILKKGVKKVDFYETYCTPQIHSPLHRHKLAKCKKAEDYRNIYGVWFYLQTLNVDCKIVVLIASLRVLCNIFLPFFSVVFCGAVVISGILEVCRQNDQIYNIFDTIFSLHGLFYIIFKFYPQLK